MVKDIVPPPPADTNPHKRLDRAERELAWARASMTASTFTGRNRTAAAQEEVRLAKAAIADLQSPVLAPLTGEAIPADWVPDPLTQLIISEFVLRTIAKNAFGPTQAKYATRYADDALRSIHKAGGMSVDERRPKG